MKNSIKIALGIGLILGIAALIPFTKTVIQAPPKEPDILVTTDTVKTGQTLASVLSQHKIDPTLIYPIQQKLASVFDLRRLQSQRPYEILTSTTGEFRAFIYRDTATHSFQVQRSTMSGDLSVHEQTLKTHWKTTKISGTVQDNMYKSMLLSGHSENFVATVMDLVADNIFGWKIDFFTEQRPGDQYEILLEQEFVSETNQPLPGTDRLRILAARYQGSGTRLKDNWAFRYKAPGDSKSDYYDKEGQAVRKAFLRAPFTRGAFRVSSGFNPRRLHPILRTYRPHHGTDYAAATGTPVSSIGKGKVIFAGWKGGYGKCVEVRHNSKYVSRYGHLSRIAVNPGVSVAQGQYIGNVGSTGLSTGPHLHFEMLVDGVQRNFLRMDFPSAAAVAKNNLENFFSVRDTLISQLNNTTPVASSTSSGPRS